MWKDQRGAMFVMGIPLLFLLIAVCFYLSALGQSLVQREHLQDAADTSALSAAIMHARGMNLIAVTNQLMAALVAILIVVRLFESLMFTAVALGHALAFQTSGASLTVVPPAELGAETAKSLDSSLSVSIPAALRTLHVFEIGVRYGMPVAAQAEAQQLQSTQAVQAAFAVPGEYPMPVEPGTWSELCTKASEYAAVMIAWPVAETVGAHLVGRIIERGLEATTAAFASAYCGSGATDAQILAGGVAVAAPGNAFSPSQSAAHGCGAGQVVHHRLRAGLALGSEPFQIRSLVLASKPDSSAARIVRELPYKSAAARPSADPLAAASDLTHLTVAQAEYYFDTGLKDGQLETDPTQWHWEPNWRARLRRVRAPQSVSTREASAPGCGFDTLAGAFSAACSATGQASGGCPDLGFLNDLESVMVH